MPIFAYEALREPGQTVKGEIEAEEIDAATATLLDRGYHVLSIQDSETQSKRPLRLGMSLFGGLKLKDLVRFTRDCSRLLRAGLPLSEALRKLKNDADVKGWESVAGGLRASLEDGQSYSEALAKYPGVFNSLYVSLVRAGEEGGTLADVLERLADLAESREEMRAKARMAMVYPLVMLALGVVTVTVLLTVVVPMFNDVFQDTGQTLPAPTRMLIAMSSFLEAWWWVVVPLAALLAFAALRFSRSERGAKLRDNLALKLPVVNKVVIKSEIASFARTLGTLLQNGIPLIRALPITSATALNAAFRVDMLRMRDAIHDGASLSDSMGDSPLFPSMVPSVVSVGEESGSLSESLHQVAQDYEKEVERELKVLMTLLEPAMIILVGCVVGFIVMAIILPIFDLGDAFEV